MTPHEISPRAPRESVRLAFVDLLRPSPEKLVENSLPAWEQLRPGLFVVDCARIRFYNASVARALLEFSRRVAHVAPTCLAGLPPKGAALLRLLSLDLVISLEAPAEAEASGAESPAGTHGFLAQT